MRALMFGVVILAVGPDVGGGVGGAQGRPVAVPPPPVQSADPKFDPTRDAAADIIAALGDARRTNRRVILDVGGEWCGWCHTLDRYFVQHGDLRALRDTKYVWLKVNYSTENKNTSVLSRYPTITGYPHLFVLEQDGSLLHSQDTVLLESGSTYDYDRMKAFLMKWAKK
jgi:thiol:disulfide interchange protein